MCESFRVSSAIIDPGYHIILLSYHPPFDSNCQTVPRKDHGENIPIKSINQLDLERYIMRRCKTKKERHHFFLLLFFLLHPRQKMGQKENKQTAASCQVQNRSVKSSYCHLPDQSQFFFFDSPFITTRR